MDSDVMLLAGGRGLRLSELTASQPKCLARIGERPILELIMQHFANHGMKRFVLCLGYRADMVVDYFRVRAPQLGWEVVFSDAGEDASKAERIAEALSSVQTPRFMLSYGDDLSDVDLSQVVSMALKANSIVTLTAIQPFSPFGTLQTNAEGIVSCFEEKSRMDSGINGGYMSVSTEIAPLLTLGELEEEVFAELVKQKKISAYKHTGFWKSMNTHKEFCEMNTMQQTGQLRWLSKRG
ncbi:MAG: NTP transferase domain-containing protein [Myxococcales bacterium]|nr:MAG: NTP transferase domain-containing protein [Myxococcales bacterium]